MRGGPARFRMLLFCLAAAQAGPSAAQQADPAGTPQAPGQKAAAKASLTKELMKALWETSTSPVSQGSPATRVPPPAPATRPHAPSRKKAPLVAKPTTRPTTAPAAPEAGRKPPAVPTTAPSVPGPAGPTTQPAARKPAVRPGPTTRPGKAAVPAGAAAGAPAAKKPGDGTDALAAVAHRARDGRQIPREVLARLRGMPASMLARPVSLANGLFRTGQYQAALVFYELALKKGTGTETRAWLLFQAGNCQRHSDPAAARKAYQQLAREFPDCPWTPVAKMLDRLLQWRELNKPTEALKGLEPDGPYWHRTPVASQ